MEGHTVNSTDGVQLNNIVFDNGKSEKLSWNFCDCIILQQSEVLFFKQANLYFIIANTNLLQRVFDPRSCDEKTV